MVEVVEGGTGPGPLPATAGGVATAAAGRHPQGAAVAEATAVALPDQSAEVGPPGKALPALTAGPLLGLFLQPAPTCISELITHCSNARMGLLDASSNGAFSG